MDYGQAFTFVTRDKNWVSRMLIGVVFALFLPLGGLGAIPLTGWAIAIARGVIRGQADPLPDWEEMSRFLVDGLKALVVFFIWNIPAWALGLVAGFVDSPAVEVISLCCGTLFGLLIAILSLGAFGLLADDRPFGEVVNPANAWRVVSANWANTILCWIVAVVGMLVATIAGSIICLIGIIPGWAYGFALGGHLYGQLYREALSGKEVMPV